jgi:hypothetical protein
MNKTELADSIKNGMFADRETLEDAYGYATNVATSLGGNDSILCLTAIHVLLNTLAKEIEKLEDVK